MTVSLLSAECSGASGRAKTWSGLGHGQAYMRELIKFPGMSHLESCQADWGAHLQTRDNQGNGRWTVLLQNNHCMFLSSQSCSPLHLLVFPYHSCHSYRDHSISNSKTPRVKGQQEAAHSCTAGNAYNSHRNLMGENHIWRF